MSFMIDTNELQGLQDVYAQVANLFIFCVDETGKRINKLVGVAGAIALIGIEIRHTA